MLNFVICDNEEVIRKQIIMIVSKLMMPIDIDYKTYEFSSYNRDFERFIDKKIGKKIYILDVEMDGSSGLDAARLIREKDWESLIIILTAHYELAHEAFKNRLMLLDYISKFDNYEKKMQEVLELGIKITDISPSLDFIFNRTAYRIPFDDILYIAKDEVNRQIKIKTFYEDYISRMTLSEAKGKLGCSFFQTHRACIVNGANIKMFDFRNNVIIFKNDEKIKLLSKNYKKEVKKIWV